MSIAERFTEYLVVGSGICGLTIASRLTECGRSVTVLDKGKAPGGRTATRRVELNGGKRAVFDYGAQYFTARDKIFTMEVGKWVDSGIVKEWSAGFWHEDGTFKGDDVPRYIGVPNMRSIALHLVERIDVRQSEKVVNIEWTENKWVITSDNNNLYHSGYIVLTSPVPQSLELLSDSSINIEPDKEQQLKEIEYNPCIALMLVCEGQSSIYDPGGMWFKGEPVSWIADNSKKGVSGDVNCITIHCGPQFSKDNWGEANYNIFSKILDYFNKINSCDVKHYLIHKWLYSKPARIYDKPFEYVNSPGTIYFAGDAFVSANIEGAFLSGYHTAEYILRT